MLLTEFFNPMKLAIDSGESNDVMKTIIDFRDLFRTLSRIYSGVYFVKINYGCFSEKALSQMFGRVLSTFLQKSKENYFVRITGINSLNNKVAII